MPVRRRLYSPTGKPRDAAVATHSREIRQFEANVRRELTRIEAAARAAQDGVDGLDGLSGASTYPVVVRDIDYTAETNATLSDGAVTLGDVLHRVQNSAATSQFDVVNGTGIVIRYKTSGAGSTVISSGNTAPGIWTYQQDAIEDFAPLHRYLFMWNYDIRATGITFETDGEGVAFFLQKAGNLSGVDVEYTESSAAYESAGFLRMRNASATDGVAWQASADGALVRAWYRLNAYDNVGAVVSRDGHVVEAFAGNYAADWPAVGDLRAVGRSMATTSTDSSFYNLGLTRAIVALIGASGNANPHGVDIHRLRIYDLGP